ncbi:MAG TPA: redox-regulated ATPase YchF [bacterium (Candidatus Stahlbacteria)]|nr:redox-regulated ATPase YchF [Candidatus Stahlbacteria bacterium]
MKLGIVGLPNVGKTTLFNLLTNAGSEVANYPFTTIERNIGIAPVSDERFDLLVETIRPKKATRAQIEIIDVAGLVEGASKGEGLGNQFLSNIRDVDLIIHLVRGFRANAVSHPYTDINPERDYEVIRTEFLLSDLEIVNRRLKKMAKGSGEEHEFLTRVSVDFQKGIPPDPNPRLKGYGLISIKPELLVINLDEVKGEMPLDGYPISLKLEEEMVGLGDEEKRSFRREYRLEPRGVDGIIEEATGMLGMISFYTIKGDESRAWLAPKGTKVIDGAGMIHTDLKKGFIKAEVAKVEDVITLGGFSTAHETGKVKTEGKEYLIEDGDVLLIRFHL